MYILLFFLFILQINKGPSFNVRAVQAYQMQLGRGLSLIVFFDPALAL